MRPRAAAGRRKPPREGRQFLEQGGGRGALCSPVLPEGRAQQRWSGRVPTRTSSYMPRRNAFISLPLPTLAGPGTRHAARPRSANGSPGAAAGALPLPPGRALQVYNRSGARCAPRLQQTRHPTLLTSPDTLGVPGL